MHFDRFLTLMYHNVVRDGGLQSGECATLSPSVTTYFLEESKFREHLQMLAKTARVITMSEVEAFFWNRFNPPSLNGPEMATDRRPCVLLTFDDGWRGCLTVATDPLREAGLQGLMFVTTGLVGTGGFCTWEELRNRDQNVWQIGSHTVSHGFLNEEPIRVVYKELRESKQILEDILEEPVNVLSIPNGAVSDSVRAIARDVGYSYVFTSEVQINSRESSPLNLGRIAVHTGTSTLHIEHWLKGQIRNAVWKSSVLQVAKYLLGPRRYRLLRRRWLGEKEEQLPMPQLESDALAEPSTETSDELHPDVPRGYLTGRITEGRNLKAARHGARTDAFDVTSKSKQQW